MQQPPSKRPCRRRVARATVARVPAETWLVVCANLFFSPHTVFRLMMACKHVWEQIGRSDAWWAEFAQRVLRYQECLSHSNIRAALQRHLRAPGCGPRQALQLVCSPRCSGCGARYGHHVFRPLRCRLCAACSSGRLVSNRVLAARYGLDFADFLAAYRQQGGLVLPLDHYGGRYGAANMLRLSRDPLDHVEYGIPVLFLQRADVERTLGRSLEDDALPAQRRRRAAAQRLAAAVRRLHAAVAFATAVAKQAGGLRHRMRAAADALRCHEVRRAVAPAAPRVGHLAGGPFCAADAEPRVAAARRPHLSLEKAQAAMRLAHCGAPPFCQRA